ncbi:uncharacterized protein [Haliotis cracherodii]|uniref:uncharacterized protein n=1 Tax=Haliotis cracherodii TaxID=6455 RepID=UPI0039ED21CC
MPDRSFVIQSAFVFGATLTIGVLTEIIYQGLTWWRTRRKEKNQFSKVLFFPDREVACKAHFQTREGCSHVNCRYSHKDTSLSELYKHLGRAEHSLDVCVFVICCQDLADILIQLHKQGKVVRIITDDEQVEMAGSQIWRFRKEGVSVRTDHSSFFMHHKFVIVDKKILINGSFNWSRSAITGNQENLLITNNPDFVVAYQKEFEKLWKEFDPRNFNKSDLHRRKHQLPNSSTASWD